MRFTTVLADGATSAAVLEGGEWRALPARNLSELLLLTSLEAAADSPGEALMDAVPGVPLPAPTKVICCGLNYAGHLADLGRELPDHPTFFAKYPETLAGPTDDLVLPTGLDVDWEAELAVVVGATLRGADRQTAAAGIAGYTVANDISVRNWERHTFEWFQGKAWDATTPLGPVVVTPDEADPAAGLDVVCRVNGEEVQRDSTRALVFDPAEVLAYISTITVLRPGDVVLTGTPSGVGVTRDPPWFLGDGDVVETEIAGIGTLRNTVRFSHDRPQGEPQWNLT